MQLTAHRRTGKRPIVRWLLGGAVAVVLLGAIAAVILALNWPFTRKAVTETLESRFARQVVIQKFRLTFFPPGCVAEGVSFLHRRRKDLPPLITARTLIIRAGYTDLIRPGKRISSVDITGLHVTVPPSDPNVPSPVMPLNAGQSKHPVGIDRITSKDAVLEFISREPGKQPFKLNVQDVLLEGIAENGRVSFKTTLINAEPPGRIIATGQFGPWNVQDPGSTALAGSYTFDHADLSVFHDIAGILSAKGNFSGSVRHTKTDGTVNVQDFHVDGSVHTAQVAAKFQADVDAENGNVSLQTVECKLRRTTILSKGEVAAHSGEQRKTVGLEMWVDAGRVEDLLLLFTSEKQASMTGGIQLRATVKLPPGEGFLKRLQLSGDFGIGGGKFTNAKLQTPLNHVSESAHGESKEHQEEDPRTVLSNLRGHVDARDGIATLKDISFALPGGSAQMRGTFNLLSKAVDIQGVLRTDGKLSDATSGFKALVLKVVTPFLKKQKTTVVPFTIKGTSSNPKFALDFDGKRHL